MIKSYVKKHEVRAINKKLEAIDLEYNDKENDKMLELIVANIIQGSYTSDMSNAPVIVDLKADNFTDDALEKIRLINTESVIVQVNNRLLDDQEIARKLRQIKNFGYKLIIEVNKDDKYVSYAKMMADIIKIDIKNIPTLMLNSGEFLCKRLAYNVDTAEDYILAESSNIDYYEGEYISTSVDMDIRQNGHSKVNFLEVIKLVHDGTDIESLSRVISRDPLLSAQLIRMCNSTNNKVSSVNEAVKILGLKRVERWIYLLQFVNKNTISEDLIRESYSRAELCRRLTLVYNFKELKAEQAYMIGLFSELDILAGRSMNDELKSLNLNKKIEDALVYHDGIGGDLINLVIAYEEANWDRVNTYAKKLKVDKEKLFKLYFESVTAVARIWDELEAYGGQSK